MHRSIALLTLLGSAVGASSASSVAAPPAQLQALSACLAITGDAARLACLDTEATKLVAAANKHDLVILGRKDMQETRRGLFGFSLPKMSLFGSGGGDAHDDVAEIDAVVQSVAPLGYGKWRMKLEDGGTWDTTEEVAWSPPHAGSKVHIKRGAFGSYYIMIDRTAAIRAMRTN